MVRIKLRNLSNDLQCIGNVFSLVVTYYSETFLIDNTCIFWHMVSPAHLPLKGDGGVQTNDERGVTRRGLRRDAAASYVGVSPTKFDELVKDRRMPKPFHIDGCVLWDIRKLDAAFDALRDGEGNPWDDDQ